MLAVDNVDMGGSSFETHSFKDIMTHVLATSPFPAFFFECPPITRTSVRDIRCKHCFRHTLFCRACKQKGVGLKHKLSIWHYKTIVKFVSTKMLRSKTQMGVLTLCFWHDIKWSSNVCTKHTFCHRTVDLAFESSVFFLASTLIGFLFSTKMPSW